jgi:hypothetical protein
METINAARTHGLAVPDYLESHLNEEGTSQEVIEKLASLGVIDSSTRSVCEIGTGAGRFLQKTLAKCKPVQYESYEPDAEWVTWLEEHYEIVSRPTDGFSLRHTATGSMDLVHAHGVFVYLPFLTTYSYLREMVRVAAAKAYVVFDIFTEDCLDETTVDEWLHSRWRFPVILPRRYVIDLFETWGFALQSEFFSRYHTGKSHYMVFQRKS